MRRVHSLWVIFLIVGWSVSQETSSLTAEVLVNADHGWPTKIIVTGYSHSEVTWLGISLYPYGTIEAEVGGRHSNIELKKGDFTQEILVDQPLLGGSFEIALWNKKVDKIDCTLDYCHWCKVNGYHFDEILIYKSGLLNIMTGY